MGRFHPLRLREVSLGWKTVRSSPDLGSQVDRRAIIFDVLPRTARDFRGDTMPWTLRLTITLLTSLCASESSFPRDRFRPLLDVDAPGSLRQASSSRKRDSIESASRDRPAESS